MHLAQVAGLDIEACSPAGGVAVELLSGSGTPIAVGEVIDSGCSEIAAPTVPFAGFLAAGDYVIEVRPAVAEPGSVHGRSVSSRSQADVTPFDLTVSEEPALPLVEQIFPTIADGSVFNGDARISGDGRTVGLNMLIDPNDPEQKYYVSTLDLVTGITTRVDVPDGPPPAEGAPERRSSSTLRDISPDGRYVVFDSNEPDLQPIRYRGEASCVIETEWGPEDVICGEVYVRDLVSQTTTAVSAPDLAGDGGSGGGSISDDGRFVAFMSHNTNLVPGDTNNRPDVFVRDLQTDTTSLVSVAADGGAADELSVFPVISGDGTTVLFGSGAHNLAADGNPSNHHIYARNLQAGTTERVATGFDIQEQAYDPRVNRDGTIVAFESQEAITADDDHPGWDVYVTDRTTGSFVRTDEVGAGLGASHGGVSGDGRHVVVQDFEAGIEVFDRLLDTTRKVAQNSYYPSISDDGRFIVFAGTDGVTGWPTLFLGRNPVAVP